MGHDERAAVHATEDLRQEMITAGATSVLTKDHAGARLHEEIAKAVRIVLKKDPFINGDRIRVGVKQSVVTLEGVVPSVAQNEMAEFDAWYVFGVDKVVNRLEIRP